MITTLILVSCGGEYGKGDRDLIYGEVGQVVSIPPSLDSNAQDSLRSICSSLRTKRMDVQSATDINTVLFEVTAGVCTGAPTARQSVVFVNADYGGQVKFVPSNPGDYLLESRAQTDTDGVLKEFCNASLNNLDVNAVYDGYLQQGIAFAFNNINMFVRSVIIRDAQNEDRIAEKYTYELEANADDSRNALIEKVTYESQCTNENVKVDSQVLIQTN